MHSSSLLSLMLILAAGGVSAPMLQPTAHAENIVFPADAGIIDVTRAPYYARGDGRTDDTRAIQQAINDHPNQGAVIYLPNGVYLISETLRWSRGAQGGSEEKNIILQGQSQDHAILRLPDRSAGFSDPARPRAMVWTGQAPAQRFRNAVRNLTLDTGRSNPGAIGMQFMANNQGCVRQVTIRSGDGSGPIGLDMAYTDEEGPLLVRNLRVVGFQIGIKTATSVDSETLQHIALEGQSEYGFYNDGQCVSIEDLKYRGPAAAVYNAGSGVMTLLNARLHHTGSAADRPAIENQAALWVRDLQTSGYSQAIRNTVGTNKGATGPRVGEWISHPVLSLFPSPPVALGLPVKDTPDVQWDNLRSWSGPTRFGVGPDDDRDASAAIQAAIDSGKTTVYLPRGNFRVGHTIHIRGRVRRVIGCEASIEVIPPLSGTAGPVFRFEDGTAPVVRLERLSTSFASGPFYFLEHAARRTLVISSVAINFQGPASYRNSGAGALFLEDVVGGDWRFRNQTVWARQFNVENSGTHVSNEGGRLWILGLKTERGGTLIETRAGGRTELLGAFCYTTTNGRLAPMFVNHESSLSATIGESWFNHDDSPYTVLVEETRAGVTRTLKHGQAPGRTGGSMLPLYTGYVGRRADK